MIRHQPLHHHVWVIKHKDSTKPIADGVYQTKKEAERVFRTIPKRVYFEAESVCDGSNCNGCRDEYELLEFTLESEPVVWKKLEVQFS